MNKAKNQKKISVQEILDIHNYEVINGEKADTKKEITGPSIHRLGLELSGAIEFHDDFSNIVSWGTKESRWIKSIGAEVARKQLRHVLEKSEIPLILLSSKVSDEAQNIVVEEAGEFNIPVVNIGAHLSDLTLGLGSFLTSFFAKEEQHHGTLMIINGVGVMIIGKSGIGKSEAALELIQDSHSFVTDDSVVIRTVADKSFGSSPELTYGMLEARGIGIINIPHVYGSKVMRESTEIELVVEMVNQDENESFDRLGTNELFYKVNGTKIPQIRIPVNKGRSVSNLIVAATNSFLAKKNGANPLEIIRERNK